jgi:phosphoribulokinase
MYEQTLALKNGKSVMKPIYNHVTGLLDPAEKIESPKVLVRHSPSLALQLAPGA